MSRFKPRGRKDSVRPFGFKPKGNNNLKLFKPPPLFPPDGYEGDIELDNKIEDLFENNLNLEEESLDQLRDQFNPKLLGKRDSSIISYQPSVDESESEAEYLDAITVKRPPRKTSRSNSEHYTDLINPPSLSGDNTSDSDQRLSIVPPESSEEENSDTMTEDKKLVDSSPERVVSPADIRKSMPLSPITEERKMTPPSKPLGPVKPLSPTPPTKALSPTPPSTPKCVKALSPTPPSIPKAPALGAIPAAIPAIPAISPIPPKVATPTPKVAYPTPKEPEKEVNAPPPSPVTAIPSPAAAAHDKETLLMSPSLAKTSSPAPEVASPVPKVASPAREVKTSKTSSPAPTPKAASPTPLPATKKASPKPEVKSPTPKAKSPAPKTASPIPKTASPKVLSPVPKVKSPEPKATPPKVKSPEPKTAELKPKVEDISKPSAPKERPKSGKKEPIVKAAEATVDSVLSKVETARPKSAKLAAIPDIPQLDVLTKETVPRIATPTGERPLSGKSAIPSIPKTDDARPKAELGLSKVNAPKVDTEAIEKPVAPKEAEKVAELVKQEEPKRDLKATPHKSEVPKVNQKEVPAALDIKATVFPKAEAEKKALEVNAIPSISNKELKPDTKEHSRELKPVEANKKVDSAGNAKVNSKKAIDDKGSKEPIVEKMAAPMTKEVRDKESNYIDSTTTKEPPIVKEGHVMGTKSEVPSILSVERKTLPPGTDPVVLEQEAAVINQETLLIEAEIARLQQVQESGSRPGSGKKERQVLAQEIAIIETEQEIARLQLVLQESPEEPTPVVKEEEIIKEPVKAAKSEKKEKFVRSDSVTSKAGSDAGSTRSKTVRKPAERRVSTPKKPDPKKKTVDPKTAAAEKKKAGVKPKKSAEKPKQPTITRTNLKPSKEEVEKKEAEEAEKTKLAPEPETTVEAEPTEPTKSTIEDKSDAYLKFPEGPLDGGISEINFRRSLDYDEGDLSNMYAQYYSSRQYAAEHPRPKSSGCCSVKREQVSNYRVKSAHSSRTDYSEVDEEGERERENIMKARYQVYRADVIRRHQDAAVTIQRKWLGYQQEKLIEAERKRLEEEKAIKKRLEEIVCSMAARKIQRLWRTWLHDKAQKDRIKSNSKRRKSSYFAGGQTNRSRKNWKMLAGRKPMPRKVSNLHVNPSDRDLDTSCVSITSTRSNGSVRGLTKRCSKDVTPTPHHRARLSLTPASASKPPPVLNRSFSAMPAVNSPTGLIPRSPLQLPTITDSVKSVGRVLTQLGVTEETPEGDANEGLVDCNVAFYIPEIGEMMQRFQHPPTTRKHKVAQDAVQRIYGSDESNFGEVFYPGKWYISKGETSKDKTKQPYARSFNHAVGLYCPISLRKLTGVKKRDLLEKSLVL